MGFWSKVKEAADDGEADRAWRQSPVTVEVDNMAEKKEEKDDGEN